jgi:hypothetical protein
MKMVTLEYAIVVRPGEAVDGNSKGSLNSIRQVAAPKLLALVPDAYDRVFVTH